MNLRRTKILIHNVYLDHYNLNLKDEYFVRRGVMYSGYYCNINVKNKSIIKKHKHLFDIASREQNLLSKIIKVKIFKPIIAGSYKFGDDIIQDMIVVQILKTNGLVFVKLSDIQINLQE